MNPKETAYWWRIRVEPGTGLKLTPLLVRCLYRHAWRKWMIVKVEFERCFDDETDGTYFTYWVLWEQRERTVPVNDPRRGRFNLPFYFSARLLDRLRLAWLWLTSVTVLEEVYYDPINDPTPIH